MKTDKPTQQSVSSGSGAQTNLVIFGTIADTTWRMFVPVLGGTLIGYFVDKMLGSLPIGVFTGLGIGIIVAVLLIVMQYRSVMGDKK